MTTNKTFGVQKTSSTKCRYSLVCYCGLKFSDYNTWEKHLREKCEKRPQ